MEWNNRGSGEAKYTHLHYKHLLITLEIFRKRFIECKNKLGMILEEKRKEILEGTRSLILEPQIQLNRYCSGFKTSLYCLGIGRS